MKDKLLALWAKVQPLLNKLYSWSPFVAGLLAGYFGHPFIKLAVALVKKLI